MYGWIRDISRVKASDLASHAGQEPLEVTSNLPQVVPNREGAPIGKDFERWIEDNSSNTETLIIGGGLAGTATAFSLSELGIQSTLLEQGSSLAPGKSSFVLFYLVLLCVQYEDSVIWPLHLAFFSLHLTAFTPDALTYVAITSLSS